MGHISSTLRTEWQQDWWEEHQMESREIRLFTSSFEAPLLGQCPIKMRKTFSQMQNGTLVWGSPQQREILTPLPSEGLFIVRGMEKRKTKHSSEKDTTRLPSMD